MKMRNKKRAVFAVSAIVVAIFILIIVICCALPSCSTKLDFTAEFYYVCYKSPTDVQSAASVSGVVHSYGGAGYIIENGGNYYVTVSCYYEENDANSVCANLNNKGLSCKVICADRQKITLPPSAKNNGESYKGTLSTLRSLSVMCYDLANGMDGNTHNQSSAKSLLGEVKTGLEGLLRANKTNCFSQELSALIAECDDVSHGYVFSYDVRRLQIAITDSIIHVQLY